MTSCKSKSPADTVYNQEFKTRMLAAGWTHLNDIYEFEAFRSVHRKEMLIMVVPVSLPRVPSMTTLDLGAYSVVADMPTRFQYADTGLYFRESSLSSLLGDVSHMNEDSWFEQYALLGQIHNESLAAAHASYANAEQRLVEALRDHPLEFSDGRTCEEVANTSFAFVNK